ncbi:MAG TPA: hypothetical protein VMK31_05695, partial [Sphingomicrobium sp.]|nr:hypothetical protein [Sphingomicrobium sp.]
VRLADDHYDLDIGRARKLLGWEPRHHITQRLPKMIEALKRDPKGWSEKNGMNPDRIEGQSGEIARRSGKVEGQA